MRMALDRHESWPRRTRGREVVALLDAWAADAGSSWVAALRSSLVAEGRKPVGGWPGTLSEARSRARAHYGRVPNAAAHEPALSGEIERAARLLNRAARRAWLSTAERELGEEI